MNATTRNDSTLALPPRDRRTGPLANVALAFASLVGLAGMALAGEPSPCSLPNVAGTIDLPAQCDVVSAGDAMQISNGLPLGTTIEIEPTWHDFINVVNIPGGIFPGGEIQQFDGTLQLTMDGTGALAGFHRDLFMQVFAETHSAAPSPGDALQTMDVEIVQLWGSLFGDPDFDSLTFRTGQVFGLPASGTLHLVRQGGPGSPFVVESFFDIDYRIDFSGAAGSVLDSMLGTTFDDANLGQGDPAWSEWGPGKPCGSIFIPDLSAYGPLSAGSTNSLILADAPPSTPAFLVLGLAPLDAPFKGGLMGPNPDVIVNLASDPTGSFQLVYQWPAVPAGFRMWAQVWMQVGGAADPFCATQTLMGTSR